MGAEDSPIPRAPRAPSAPWAAERAFRGLRAGARTMHVDPSLLTPGAVDAATRVANEQLARGRCYHRAHRGDSRCDEEGRGAPRAGCDRSDPCGTTAALS